MNAGGYKQSLDDDSLLFWNPDDIEDEWPYIYFLKLEEGKVTANTDLGSPI